MVMEGQILTRFQPALTLLGYKGNLKIFISQRIKADTIKLTGSPFSIDPMSHLLQPQEALNSLVCFKQSKQRDKSPRAN